MASFPSISKPNILTGPVCHFIIQNSAAGNIPERTEGPKTRAARVLMLVTTQAKLFQFPYKLFRRMLSVFKYSTKLPSGRSWYCSFKSRYIIFSFHIFSNWYSIKFAHLVLRISGMCQRRGSCPLKVPKRENFSLAFFAQSEPIWVCDLGSGKKNRFFYQMIPDFEGL